MDLGLLAISNKKMRDLIEDYMKTSVAKKHLQLNQREHTQMDVTMTAKTMKHFQKLG